MSSDSEGAPEFKRVKHGASARKLKIAVTRSDDEVSVLKCLTRALLVSHFFFHNQTLTDVDSKASKNLSSGSGSESGSDGGSDGDSDGDSKSDSASDSESHSDSNSDSSSDSSSDGDKSGDQDAAKRKAQVFVLYLLARSECFIFFSHKIGPCFAGGERINRRKQVQARQTCCTQGRIRKQR